MKKRNIDKKKKIILIEIKEIIKKASEFCGSGTCGIGFQGGEPMLAGIDFYKNILGAQNGVVSIVGTNDKAKVEKLLNDTFGKWNSKSKYEKAYPTFTATKKEDKLYNIPDKENAAAVGSINFKMNRESLDYAAMIMANEMIGSGGFLSARIPM